MPGVTRNRGAALAPLALVLTVSACTVAVYSRTAIPPDALAASPERVAEGRLWLLVTSALYTSHPVVISLLGFAALAGLALATCGARVFWVAAAAGHLGSTLLVYLCIALARIFEPGAFQSAVSSADYGVSAVLWAWLGAVAAVAWSARARTGGRRVGIVLCCAAFALVAYTLHPALTILSAEHPVAFVLGALVGSGGIRRLTQWERPKSSQLSPASDPGYGVSRSAR